MQKSEWIYGIHAVAALLDRRAEDIEVIELSSAKQHDRRIQDLVRCAEDKQVKYVWRRPAFLDERLMGDVVHQGVIAQCRMGPSRLSLQEHCQRAGDAFFGLVLDQIQDPHNLGACLRTAACVGIDVVVLPKRGAATVNTTVRKVASGGAEQVATLPVVNIVRTLQALKSSGVWVYGTDERAEKTIFELDFTRPVAMVLGGERKGLRPLVRAQCDEVVAIPTDQDFSSLNVSVACGVCLFEGVRQRSQLQC